MIYKFKNEIKAHIGKIWPDAKQELFSWTIGGIVESNPDFRVCRLSPSKDSKSWIYISIGASTYLNGKGEHLEFALLSPTDAPDHIETLAMVTHYHSNPLLRLELGSIIDIGQGWVKGSECDHLLVSFPYFKGREFERCMVDNHLIRILWLVPITKEEAIFCQKNGIDSLESEFEKKQIRITNPFRSSVF